MSNVIQFPSVITLEAAEAVRNEVRVDLIADLFKASFAAELYGDELGMTDYDIDCLSHIYEKYAERWAHLMQDSDC